MSARQIRGQLADARAMEEQNMREDMHGGSYIGGGYFQGAGGVPSMGTSQFRGGAGTSYGAFTGIRSPLVPYRGTSTSTAIVPYRPPVVTRPPLVTYRPRPAPPPTSTVLTNRTPGTIKPFNPAEQLARLRAMRASVKPTSKTLSIANKLGALGVTAAAVAAAIAAGIGINELVKYFEGVGNQMGQEISTGGPPVEPPFEPPVGPPFRPVEPPFEPPFVPPGGKPTYYAEELPWWSYSQNITARDVRGSGRRRNAPAKENDGRRARAEIVRNVMAEHGLSLPQASKYVKENGLY